MNIIEMKKILIIKILKRQTLIKKILTVKKGLKIWR